MSAYCAETSTNQKVGVLTRKYIFMRLKNKMDVYNQYNRIWAEMYRLTSLRIIKSDPATGGIHHLCHNWGNEAAIEHLSRFNEWQSKLHNIYTQLYKNASFEPSTLKVN